MDTLEKISSASTLIETKERIVDGINYGVVVGYAATWDIDIIGDRFERGAFTRSLENLRARNRDVRMLAMHDRLNRPIGVFPVSAIKEDDKGLYVEGLINLETQAGREVYALLKQRALSDFSVGVRVTSARSESMNNKTIRVIEAADLFEISIVDEPMNPAAVVVDVKSRFDASALPVAQIGHAWDFKSAQARVKDLCEAEGREYKSLPPVIDVTDGALAIVPRAVFAATAELILSGTENVKLKSTLIDCYARMGRESPFERGLGIDELRAGTLENLEGFMRRAGLNAKAARMMTEAYVAFVKENFGARNEGSENEDSASIIAGEILDQFKKLKGLLRGRNQIT